MFAGELLAQRRLTPDLILTQGALKTSEIEGERLDSDQVRSPLARRLGLETAGVLATDKQGRDVELGDADAGDGADAINSATDDVELSSAG
jgi:hypothetical protein